jgi:transposase-like protein
MQKKTRDETVKAFERELEGLGAESSGKPHAGERAMYLETQPASANGYNTRDLPTLVGSLEGLEMPRAREGDFHPRILSYGRGSP